MWLDRLARQIAAIRAGEVSGRRDNAAKPVTPSVYRRGW